MSNHENKIVDPPTQKQPDVIERGAGVIYVPDIPDGWEPPSAALVVEPASEPAPAAEPPPSDS